MFLEQRSCCLHQLTRRIRLLKTSYEGISCCTTRYVSENVWSYEEILEKRRMQAKRSVTVFTGRTDNERCNELERTITKIIRRRPLAVHGFQKESFIVELPSLKDVMLLLKNGTKHFSDVAEKVPTTTRHLYFLYSSKRHGFDPPLRNNQEMVKIFELNRRLRNSQSTSEQVLDLYRLMTQTECGVRLRFFLASYIEDVFSGIFPHMYCHPFGSSVNGLGTERSDLDLSLILDQYAEERNRSSKNMPFLFRTKNRWGDERAFAQKALESFAEILQRFVPSVQNTVKILRARVPIVRFEHSDSGIVCDLSLYNPSGCLMSKMLWTLGKIDARFRPLVFAVRKWAAELSITSGNSDVNFSTRFSNFHLLALLIFFLQNSRPQILPSFQEMRTEDGAREEGSLSLKTDYDSFIINNSSKNTASLEDLLAEFFEFYAKFDFRTQAISLEKGIAYSKPDHFPITVANPLEVGHNVTKTVGMEYLNRFVACCRGGIWLMSEGKDTEEEWGLLKILNPENYSLKQEKSERKFGEQLVNSLFEEERDEEDVSDVSEETSADQNFDPKAQIRLNFQDSPPWKRKGGVLSVEVSDVLSQSPFPDGYPEASHLESVDFATNLLVERGVLPSAKRSETLPKGSETPLSVNQLLISAEAAAVSDVKLGSEVLDFIDSVKSEKIVKRKLMKASRKKTQRRLQD